MFDVDSESSIRFARECLRNFRSGEKDNKYMLLGVRHVSSNGTEDGHPKTFSLADCGYSSADCEYVEIIVGGEDADGTDAEKVAELFYRVQQRRIARIIFETSPVGSK